MMALNIQVMAQRLLVLVSISLLIWAVAGVSQVQAATDFIKRSFVSHVDDSEDVYGVIPPKGLKSDEPTSLIVYLHGMGSNFMEPFMFPNDVSVTDAIRAVYPKFVFVSCSYGREASWGIDPALHDLTDNIKEITQQYNIERIILVGSSMGGCTVLTYAATAPEEVKKKLIGILAVESTGDLRELYYNTGYAEVQPSMEKAFHGTPREKPELYRRKSFLRNIPLLDPKLRIFLVSAHQDTTVPPRMQTELYNALRLRGFPVTLKEIDGSHGVPPATNYTEGLAYIINAPLPSQATKENSMSKKNSGIKKSSPAKKKSASSLIAP